MFYKSNLNPPLIQVKSFCAFYIIFVSVPHYFFAFFMKINLKLFFLYVVLHFALFLLLNSIIISFSIACFQKVS